MMTATAIELIASPDFWIQRIEEQVEYIARVDINNPRREEIIASAIDILEQCQERYLNAPGIQRCQQPPRIKGKEVTTMGI